MGSKDQEGGIFGWRNWTLPDEWTTIHRDRTPKEPKENEYGHHGSGPQWTMGEVPVIGGDKNPGEGVFSCLDFFIHGIFQCVIQT